MLVNNDNIKCNVYLDSIRNSKLIVNGIKLKKIVIDNNVSKRNSLCLKGEKNEIKI